MLLDSHVLLWVLTGDASLGPAARARIVAAPRVLYSAASLWELRIKEQLGKVVLPVGFVDGLEAAGLAELPVLARHADAIGQLDLAHRDPFDRLLLAQAVVELVPLLTADSALLRSGHPSVVNARL